MDWLKAISEIFDKFVKFVSLKYILVTTAIVLWALLYGTEYLAILGVIYSSHVSIVLLWLVILFLLQILSYLTNWFRGRIKTIRWQIDTGWLKVLFSISRNLDTERVMRELESSNLNLIKYFFYLYCNFSHEKFWKWYNYCSWAQRKDFRRKTILQIVFTIADRGNG